MDQFNPKNYKGYSICLSSESLYKNHMFYEEKFLKSEIFNKYEIMNIVPEKGNIKIDQVREIADFLSYKPVYSDIKLVFIDDFNKIGNEAENAILKILEEPPEYALIVISTDNWNNIIQTIKSRLIKVETDFFLNNDFAVEKYFENDISENISKFFLRYDYGTFCFIKNNKEKFSEIVESDYENSFETDYYIENFKINTENIMQDSMYENKIKMYISYLKIIKKYYYSDEKEKINIIDKIIKLKKDTDTLFFIKEISKYAVYILRDTILSITTYKWKYMYNREFVRFFGLREYNINSDKILSSVKYFDKMSSLKKSGFNFDMEITKHFFLLNQCII